MALNYAVLILAGAGLALSIYALSISWKVARDEAYQPACDINDRISCTKAFTSSYSNTFGVSNTFWGILFYLMMIGVALCNIPLAIRILAGMGVASTVYLAYALYIKLGTFCLVCTTIYLINVGLLIASFC